MLTEFPSRVRMKVGRQEGCRLPYPGYCRTCCAGVPSQAPLREKQPGREMDRTYPPGSKMPALGCWDTSQTLHKSKKSPLIVFWDTYKP